LNIGQNREFEAKPLRETRRFLIGVDRDRQHLGPSGVNVGQT